MVAASVVSVEGSDVFEVQPAIREASIVSIKNKDKSLFIFRWISFRFSCRFIITSYKPIVKRREADLSLLSFLLLLEFNMHKN